MTETLLALVSGWGAPALALATFLSCLALPVPTSVMMLAAGAFAASGDIALEAVLAAALAGALLGDQAGFSAGRHLGARLAGWIAGAPARRAMMDRADKAVARHGALAVFLSRWLFSPLGPYVNVLAGAAGMGWARFTAMAVLGEAVWVAIYVGLGFSVSGQITELSGLLSDSVGLVTSAALALGLGTVLFRRR